MTIRLWSFEKDFKITERLKSGNIRDGSLQNTFSQVTTFFFPEMCDIHRTITNFAMEIPKQS